MASLEQIVRPFGVETGIQFVSSGGRATDLSYDTLARRATAFGRRLGELGLEPGEPVGVILENDPESVAAALGVWMAGHALVSIPPPSRGIGEQVFREGFGRVLGHAGCTHIVGPRRGARGFDAPVRYHVLSELTADLDLDAAPLDVALPDVALIQFTSGSTSLPKGVRLTGAAVAGHVDAIDAGLTLHPGACGVSWLPLHHDMGFIGFLLTAVATRRSLVLAEPFLFMRSPLRWLELCATHRAAITGAPNFGYRVAAHALRRAPETLDLSGLQRCLAGAERISAHTMREFAEAGARHGLAPEALMPVYGLAESTLAACFPPRDRGIVEGPDDLVSVGSALTGLEYRLTDPDEEGKGRIELRGEWMLQDYVTERGIEPALDADGWFRTSDIGFRDGAELFVVGRADEVVVSRGRNLYAEDVEAIVRRVLADADVEATVAAFKPDALTSTSLAVAVELGRASTAAPDSIAKVIDDAVSEALGLRLDGIHVVPPRSIPRTTSGKVRRAACRQRLADGGFAAPDA